MDYIITNLKDRIGSITLNRPEKRNALDDLMVGELKTAFLKLNEDENCRVIIIKANGEAFCAGADLAYLQKLQKNTYDENLGDSNELMELYKMIYRSKKIVISQVQGHAIAGGCGLATVCDFCFAIPHAMFGYTEVKIGFIPAIVSVFLRNKIGEAATRKLLLTGSLITADEAHQMQIVTKIENPDKLEAAVNEFAQTLANTTSPQAIQLTKQLLADLNGMSFDEGLNYAATMNAKARATADCKKGISSFLDKTKLNW